MKNLFVISCNYLRFVIFWLVKLISTKNCSLTKNMCFRGYGFIWKFFAESSVMMMPHAHFPDYIILREFNNLCKFWGRSKSGFICTCACGVAGCSNSRKNAPDAGFFRLPSIITTDKRSEELSRNRRSQWLSKINRKNLTACQLAEKNSTLHVCGKHFINGKPSAMYETADCMKLPKH